MNTIVVLDHMSVPISYQILTALPQGASVQITYVLTCAPVNYTQTIAAGFDSALLDQGVTDAMSFQERQSQIQSNFLILTRPQFEYFAEQAEGLMSASDVVNDIVTSGVAELTTHPLVGVFGQVDI